jgi:hypothetical protein
MMSDLPEELGATNNMRMGAAGRKSGIWLLSGSIFINGSI